MAAAAVAVEPRRSRGRRANSFTSSNSMAGAAAFAAAVQRGQKPYSRGTAIRNDRAFSSIVSHTPSSTHSNQQTAVNRLTSRQQDDRRTGRADDYDGLLIPEHDGETNGFVRREMQSVLLSSTGSTGSGEDAGGRRRSLGDRYAPQLSKVQKKGCFQYIKRRHSTALAFASNARNLPTLDDEEPPFCDQDNDTDNSGSNWEYVKSKHGVHVYKSKRCRCEVRAVTQVNASVKNVMALLSAGESTESFAHAQKILLGGDQVYDAKVLASCVPSSGSRYFHCGLKYMAMKNPFGVTPLDLVFLDYTDVSTSPDDKLVGFRVIESIRVPEFRALPKYTRASIRCEVYIVRETNEMGVVEVTFASHLDPKSKYSSAKKTHWLDLAATRLQNLRSYAEKASFSHRLILEKGNWIKRDSRQNCSVCESSFTFLRKRHNCRLCGEVSCGRCCRKLPILVDTETTRVRVCLGCILESRRQPDELGRTELDDEVGEALESMSMTTRLLDSPGDVSDQAENSSYRSVSASDDLPNEHLHPSGDSFWDDEATTTLLPPKKQDEQAIIDVLADELLQRDIPDYLDAFELVIPETEVVVGAVPLEEVRAREEEVELARLRHAQLEIDQYRQREVQLAQQEESARDRLREEDRQRQNGLRKKQEQFAEAMQWRTYRLRYVFQQAEERLVETLQAQKAHVHRIYGNLAPSLVPHTRKRYRATLQSLPITIEIQLKMLKSVKDKLPSGQYAVVATVYDRLGGHALRWTAFEHNSDHRQHEPRSKRPHFTKPFHHRGRFYNAEVLINQSINVVCPPESSLRPGNALLFELFQLDLNPQRRRGLSARKSNGMALDDQVVAWGAIPLTTPDFHVLDGKFKVPLLRGEVDPTMDKYRDIEKMYHDDLSAWLCNFYFQVSPLESDSPKKHAYQSLGVEVEIDERSGLFQLDHGEHQNLRIQEPGFDDAGASASVSANQIRPRKHAMRKVNNGDEQILAEERQYGSANASSKTFRQHYSTSTTLLLDDHAGSNESRRKSSVRKKPNNRKSMSTQGLLKLGSIFNWPGKKPVKTRIHPGEESDDENKAAQAGRPINSSRQLSHSRPQDVNYLTSKLSNFAGKKEVNEPNESEDPFNVENYMFSVNAAASVESAHLKRFHAAHKLRYLWQELVVDLGIGKSKTMECWSMIVMMLFSLWLRVYVHYLMQWLFLWTNRIPVYTFQPQWTTCLVKYTWKTIATPVEIGVIVFGVLGNAFFFVFLSLSAMVSQQYVGELPRFGSNFIVCIGLAMILDPYLILLVDVSQHHYSCSKLSECAVSIAATACRCAEGDAFKLYVRFLAQEGSGLVGIVIIIIVYAALTCATMSAFYMYLLHVHMNGRMLDLYRRIHMKEHDFFLPHDSEIALSELQAICEQATRWKGPSGSQRKVFVHEYVLTDPLDDRFQEKNVHISVYNMELDGTRELHRHFLKSHDGAIVELFGEIGTGSGGSWQHNSHGSAASLALLYNIIQEHQEPAEAMDQQLQALFDGL